MALAMVLFPLFMAGLAALIPSNRFRPWLLPFAALAHGAMTVLALARPDLDASGDWLVLDPPGKLVLLVVSGLFLFCSFYAVGYLRYRRERSNRIFTACLLVFLGVMSLVTWAHHLGLMWVAMEATTLSTAPLIYFNHSKRSIEATWKYLLVGSVGIALALLGTFFLAYSAQRQGLQPTLTLEGLLSEAPNLSGPWLRAAFILLLVGYGTKMGLAPMHTWKPDAYGEAPGVVGAIFAGGVTSVAFLAFLRIYQIIEAAGDGIFASRILLFMGLFSMAVAGLFMVGQRDFKRMLAYSSVEHMGILMVGLGIGSPALYGTMFHVLTNSATKGVLFLSAGNIHRAYASKNTDQVRGAMRRLPLSAALFVAGFLAVTGSPPFGPFMSEFSILNGAFDAGRFAAAALFLLFLLVVFIGMGKTVLKVVQGRAPLGAADSPYRDGFLTAAPVALLMCIVVAVGFYLPGPLSALLHASAAFLGGRP
ncbi:MAG: proton-conducting transporter membrane subunit [Rectinemataceae bacterium]